MAAVNHGGTYPDYIELRNPGGGSVNIGGWSLTDDALVPTLWTFPSVVLQPDERLLVFASGKGLAGPPGELHASFQLDGDGEYLALVRPDGVTVQTSFGGDPPEDAALFWLWILYQLSDVSILFLCGVVAALMGMRLISGGRTALAGCLMICGLRAWLTAVTICLLVADEPKT